MLPEREKTLAGVQVAMKIRTLKLLKEAGVMSGHDCQFRALEQFKPISGRPRKSQAAQTMLGLLQK